MSSSSFFGLSFHLDSMRLSTALEAEGGREGGKERREEGGNEGGRREGRKGGRREGKKGGRREGMREGGGMCSSKTIIC